MSKDEKNKLKDNLWFKQLGFIGLVLLWILLIIFKNSLTGPLRWGAFILMIAVTIVGLYFINKEFFGIGKDGGENELKK